MIKDMADIPEEILNNSDISVVRSPIGKLTGIIEFEISEDVGRELVKRIGEINIKLDRKGTIYTSVNK